MARSLQVIIAVLAVWLLTPPPLAAQSLYRAAQAAVLAANTADVVTSMRTHGDEVNPLLQTTPRLLLWKSAGVTAQLLIMHWLAHTGHARAATLVGFGVASVPAAAAVHNARLR